MERYVVATRLKPERRLQQRLLSAWTAVRPGRRGLSARAAASATTASSSSSKAKRPTRRRFSSRGNI